MTITVVTARDENGAPSTREVLRDGDRYRIVSGNLEIISSAREALGFYASGNWLSVHVGENVTVNPDRSNGASGGQTPAATEPALQVTDSAPGEDVAEDAETLGGRGMRPVVFRAKAYKPKEPDPEPPHHRWMLPVVFRAKATKPKEPDPEPPRNRRMRPVIIRPRTYARERDDPPAPSPDQ